LVVVSLSGLAGCVTPAFDRSDYVAKTVPTVESAISSLETARLAVESLDRHGLPLAPVEVAVTDAEDVLGSVSGTFVAIQPPSQELDALRNDVLDLLDKAEDQMGDTRIAVRRGDVEAAVAVVDASKQTVAEMEALLKELEG
jgi:hypothetical protein